VTTDEFLRRRIRTEKVYFVKMTNIGSSASSSGWQPYVCHADEHVHPFDQPRLVVIHDEPRFVMLIKFVKMNRFVNMTNFSSGRWGWRTYIMFFSAGMRQAKERWQSLFYTGRSGAMVGVGLMIEGSCRVRLPVESPLGFHTGRMSACSCSLKSQIS
jgi:hypothetical protein